MDYAERALRTLSAGNRTLLRAEDELGLLRGIDARIKRDIDAPQPPSWSQPDGEVTSPLHHAPPAELASLTEFPDETREAVVPIVIAGNGEQAWGLAVVALRHCGCERLARPAAVSLSVRCRIHEVATKHDDIGRRKQFGVPAQG